MPKTLAQTMPPDAFHRKNVPAPQPVDAGEQGGVGAQQRGEAAEEDDGAAVAPEEVLAEPLLALVEADLRPVAP